MLRYYRNDTQAVRDAWADFHAARQALNAAAAKFADNYGGKPVIVRSTSEFKLSGLKFDPAKPTDIWTAKDQEFGTQRPRATPQRGCEPARRAAHSVLKAEFYESFPKECASIDPLYKAIGTDWGNALFGGVGMFELDGVTYIETGVTVNDDCIEILGSEFAEAKARNAKSKAGEG